VASIWCWDYIFILFPDKLPLANSKDVYSVWMMKLGGYIYNVMANAKLQIFEAICKQWGTVLRYKYFFLNRVERANTPYTQQISKPLSMRHSASFRSLCISRFWECLPGRVRLREARTFFLLSLRIQEGYSYMHSHLYHCRHFSFQYHYPLSLKSILPQALIRVEECRTRSSHERHMLWGKCSLLTGNATKHFISV